MMATSEVPTITSDNAEFTNKFYEMVVKNKPGENIIFSPLSVHIVLSLVYQGTAGTTAQNLAGGLNVPDKLLTAKGYNDVIKTLNNIRNVTLNVANKIFVNEQFPVKAAFQQTASDLFLSEAESINFAACNKAASIINQWVEDKTNAKIKDLIKPEFLDESTRLVLVNAVYFRGHWLKMFRRAYTKTEPFYVTKHQKVNCQMMQNTAQYRYRIDMNLEAQILELPYVNKDISMLVILPNYQDGMEAVEKKLLNVDLFNLTANMSFVKTQLFFPKFKIEAYTDLESILIAMGMGDIFRPDKADFSEICGSPGDIYISKVVQKAFIEVNEEGAEAGAVTGITGMYFTGPLDPPMIFKVNRPFIFILQSVVNPSSKVILFYGKVMNPQKSN